MRTSHGRHGGNEGRTDKGEAKNARLDAARNSDVDSLARNRNEDRASGRSPGKD
jgi:hypothetical protein